jgi:phosphoserine phosphatase
MNVWRLEILLNAYDFDKTIYKNDSTVEFFLFCLKTQKKTLLALPKTTLYGIGYILGICEKTTFKQVFFGFLNLLDNTESTVNSFWIKNQHKIKQWYTEKSEPDDIIISASPEFLLSPVCKHATLIASRVDPKTGFFTGKNCYGKEKVVRLHERLPYCTISEFYSDSLSDAPLAQLAEKAYIVKGDNITPWPK